MMIFLNVIRLDLEKYILLNNYKSLKLKQINKKV